MLHQVLIPGPVLMIPILIMTTKGIHHTDKNSNPQSDVIVTYSNHAEAGNSDKILVTTEKSTENTLTVLVTEATTVRTTKEKESSEVDEPLQEDVLFLPNEKEVVRNDDYLQHDRVNIQDLMVGHKSVKDILASKDVRLETESPNTDIIFVVGKNNENVEHTEKPSKKLTYNDYRFNSKDFTSPPPKLNCKNLNCSNFINSVCGQKLDNNQLKIRLFMNDCYFKKVNCNFKNPVNRYKQVALDNCKNRVSHSNHTPFTFKPSRNYDDLKPVQVNHTRRNFSSRRSMTMSLTGQYCSHSCPTFCPELYEPECAVSSSGRHRVFVNHCAVDLNSCSYGIVWRTVPLSECVGGKKADMRQNSGFIGWMQRVGIVDKNGRLVLN